MRELRGRVGARVPIQKGFCNRVHEPGEVRGEKENENMRVNVSCLLFFLFEAV